MEELLFSSDKRSYINITKSSFLSDSCVEVKHSQYRISALSGSSFCLILEEELELER
ncbi:hypothetical protein F2Q68_00013672 [Brassica cretica]|uniref:Uncharacterized protein n=1 Tax=Brassica cretica TaxID=69181 RepID=A0A8S9HG48_BRACR|nr:hypothetical protein F2Q68_00013672 [Brassica cretica]